MMNRRDWLKTTAATALVPVVAGGGLAANDGPRVFHSKNTYTLCIGKRPHIPARTVIIWYEVTEKPQDISNFCYVIDHITVVAPPGRYLTADDLPENWWVYAGYYWNRETNESLPYCNVICEREPTWMPPDSRHQFAHWNDQDDREFCR